ncbi:14994_t:CDS:2 [Acaulospora morrowiae]|uniref:14994_t:CDS:1 n=1 Tax=Acaulospora morrowiae TaxID=94023 RepID=A0A9N9D1Y1_9GLOM|nr:14994_t:CDS:2 [Acaulospora morrowiae]
MATIDYDSFAIYPALNVARVGNATEEDGVNYYYVGSELPGVYVGSNFKLIDEGYPSFSFKINGKIKPQAARFRIYGFKNDENKGEIRPGNGVEITWTVKLANKKAAHMGFFGIKNQDQKGPIRNADWPYKRPTLMAVREESLTSGLNSSAVELKAQVYRNDKDEG